RLGAQIERLFHLFKGGRDARLLQPLVDEAEELILLACQHGRNLRVSESKQTMNVSSCSGCVPQPQFVQPMRDSSYREVKNRGSGAPKGSIGEKNDFAGLAGP